MNLDTARLKYTFASNVSSIYNIYYIYYLHTVCMNLSRLLYMHQQQQHYSYRLDYYALHNSLSQYYIQQTNKNVLLLRFN